MLAPHNDPLKELKDAIAIARSSNLRSGFRSQGALLRHIYHSIYSARRNTKTIPTCFIDYDFVKWIGSSVSAHRAATLKGEAAPPEGCTIDRRAFDCRPRQDPPGGCAGLQKPVFSLTQSPGFLSVGKGQLAAISVAERVKVYFALPPSAAPWALSRLVDMLDRVTQDYGVKVLAHPRMYFRSDAGVLYARLSELEDIIGIVLDSVSSGLRLRPVEPLGSRLICPGAAWAQDQIDAETGLELSFGQWISGVVAECCGDSLPSDALEGLIASAGRDPLRPYRLAGRRR